MSKKHRNRSSSQQFLRKYNTTLTEVERKLSHKRLKVRSLCTHTKGLMEPDLTYREKENGKLIWICRNCNEEIDLQRIDEKDLQKAINTINQAINLVKIMLGDSENDRRLLENVLSELHFKLNAYMMNAYKSALNSSNKLQNRRNNGRRGGSGSVTWTSETR